MSTVAPIFAALPVCSSLFLTFILRIALEGHFVFAIAESFLLIVAIQWIESFYITYLIATSIFIIFAYRQTQAEEHSPAERDDIAASHDENEMLSCPMFGSNRNIGYDSPCPPGHDYGRNSHTDFVAKHQNSFLTSLSQHQSSNPSTELHGRPLLYQCDLRHRRLIPFKDYFHHSYLYIGVPVGLRASYPPLLSVDQDRESKSFWSLSKTWFSIRPQDQAFRGGANLSLREKLDDYLLSEVSYSITRIYMSNGP